MWGYVEHTIRENQPDNLPSTRITTDQIIKLNECVKIQMKRVGTNIKQHLSHAETNVL